MWLTHVEGQILVEVASVVGVSVGVGVGVGFDAGIVVACGWGGGRDSRGRSAIHVAAVIVIIAVIVAGVVADTGVVAVRSAD